MCGVSEDDCKLSKTCNIPAEGSLGMHAVKGVYLRGHNIGGIKAQHKQMTGRVISSCCLPRVNITSIQP